MSNLLIICTEINMTELPVTRTCIGMDIWPAPSDEYGVHAYLPSSDVITDFIMSRPSLFVLMRVILVKSIMRSFLDHKI